MQYWLMKSEPETWSWEQQVKAGAKGEGWDGVRNYQASNNMKKMKKQKKSTHRKRHFPRKKHIGGNLKHNVDE